MSCTHRDQIEELGHEEAFPRLTRDLVAVLEAAGKRRTLTDGEVVSRAGEVAREFCVVIRGSLAGYEDPAVGEGAMAVRMIHQYLRLL